MLALTIELWDATGGVDTLPGYGKEYATMTSAEKWQVAGESFDNAENVVLATKLDASK